MTHELAIRPPDNMKRLLCIVGIVVSLAVGSAWLVWYRDVCRLYSPQSIVEETGLRLPEGVRITATRSQIFSLADGDNYKWLIESDSSLLPWVTANMSVESGGWEHVRLMSELGFPEEMPGDAKFGGVWCGLHYSPRGRNETSYLDLAEDGKVGILSTFRP